MAIIVLLVIAAAVVGGASSPTSGFTLPAWVPVLGKDFFELEAELSTAQAVTPGQGQTVNIAGVEVGEISSVELGTARRSIGHEDRARVRDDLPRRDDPAAPEDRPEGHDRRARRRARRRPGELAEGERDPGLADAARRQPRRDPRLARRRHARLPAAAARRRRRGPAAATGRELAQTIRRFEPTAHVRAPRSTSSSRERRAQPPARRPQLLAADRRAGRRATRSSRNFVESSNAVFAALRQPGREHARDAARAARRRSTTIAGGARARSTRWPPRSARRSRTCGRRRARSARRCAQTRPFLRETTPIIRDQIGPFTRAALPTVRELRPAMRDLAAATPDLTRIVPRRQRAAQHARLQPARRRRARATCSGSRGLNHVGARVFSTQDAHGPIRRGIVVVHCDAARAARDRGAAATRRSGTLVEPAQRADAATQICPHARPVRGRLHDARHAPSFGRIAAMVVLRAVVLRPAAVPVARVRRPDPAQAARATASRSRSPRPRSSPSEADVRISGVPVGR